MQNREAAEVEGKKVRFCLFTYDAKRAKKARKEAEEKGGAEDKALDPE